MTNEERNEILRHIEVEKAYLDGEEIECMRIDISGNEWSCVRTPLWNWTKCNYRIKPRPIKLKYRPFESAEEVMEAIKEHGGYVKYITCPDDAVYRHLENFKICENGDIEYSFSGQSGVVNWESIHYKIVWADGTPFGKLIEE